MTTLILILVGLLSAVVIISVLFFSLGEKTPEQLNQFEEESNQHEPLNIEKKMEEYLRENKIHSKYVRYCKTKKYNGFLHDDIKDHEWSKYPPVDFAFEWSLTPDGVDFWKVHSKAFKKILGKE